MLCSVASWRAQCNKTAAVERTRSALRPALSLKSFTALQDGQVYCTLRTQGSIHAQAADLTASCAGGRKGAHPLTESSLIPPLVPAVA